MVPQHKTQRISTIILKWTFFLRSKPLYEVLIRISKALTSSTLKQKGSINCNKRSIYLKVIEKIPINNFNSSDIELNLAFQYILDLYRYENKFQNL